MSGAELEVDSKEKRRILWIVLALNIVIAVAFFTTGVLGDSTALIANGLDNSSDALVYGISLVALGRPPQWKRIAARFSGVMLLVFAAGVIVEAGRRFLAGSDPLGPIMIGMAVVAAGVNLLSLYLLKRLKGKDVNLRAATTFSFNDFISNGGILIGGAVVMWTGQNWPDLLVGAAVAAIAVYGGIEILRDVSSDARRDETRGG